MSESQVTGTLRRLMPDLYFINTPVAQMRPHLTLLARLPNERLILDFQERPGTPLTELTVCAYDDEQPGLLSKVCGTLAAAHINIATAFVYTLGIDSPGSTGPDAGGSADSSTARPAVLDILLLSEPYRGRERALTDKTMQRARTEAMRVLQGQITAAQLLAKAHRRPHPPLNIYEIAATNDQQGQSVIKLRAEDHPGVLYRTTAAMAALGLNICVAQINSEAGVVDDIFYVTDAQGEALTETALKSITPRLRSILQDSTVPSGLTGNMQP